jgi:hypothetical protein
MSLCDTYIATTRLQPLQCVYFMIFATGYVTVWLTVAIYWLFESQSLFPRRPLKSLAPIPFYKIKQKIKTLTDSEKSLNPTLFIVLSPLCHTLAPLSNSGATFFVVLVKRRERVHRSSIVLFRYKNSLSNLFTLNP